MHRVLLQRKLGNQSANVIAHNTQVTTEDEQRLSEKLRFCVTSVAKEQETMTLGTLTTLSQQTQAHHLHLLTNLATSQEATNRFDSKNQLTRLRKFSGGQKRSKKRSNKFSND